MKLIDLSFPIKAHWRWGFELKLKHSLENGDDFRASIMTLPTHCYTHVDTLLHCKKGGDKAIDELSIDTYSGKATVIDLSEVANKDHSISKEDIQNNLPKCYQKGDIILLKTLWDDKSDIMSKEYWTDAPFVSEEAANYLYSLAPKAVGVDFPQDEILKQAATYKGCLPLKGSTTHELLLLKGVFLIEYLHNLKAIKKERVDFIALPLNVVGAEGGPVRAAVIESLD